MPRVAWKSFTEGRALARGLELKGKKEWKKWSKSDQRPSDIPANPDQTYRDAGWVSWPDWLGNGKRYDMLPFAVGRAYVRKLKLKSRPEWREWRKSDQRPSDIPASPERTYRDDGWISYPDWLGYGSAGGGAAASRSSSSSSSATTAPKKKTKKKRKRRPATSHPSDLPPPTTALYFPLQAHRRQDRATVVQERRRKQRSQHRAAAAQDQEGGGRVVQPRTREDVAVSSCIIKE